MEEGVYFTILFFQPFVQSLAWLEFQQRQPQFLFCQLRSSVLQVPMLRLLYNCNLRKYLFCACSSIIIVPIYTRMRRCVSVIYTELARDYLGKQCRQDSLSLAGLMEFAGVGVSVWEVYRHIQTIWIDQIVIVSIGQGLD